MLLARRGSTRRGVQLEEEEKGEYGKCMHACGDSLQFQRRQEVQAATYVGVGRVRGGG